MMTEKKKTMSITKELTRYGYKDGDRPKACKRCQTVSTMHTESSMCYRCAIELMDHSENLESKKNKNTNTQIDSKYLVSFMVNGKPTNVIHASKTLIDTICGLTVLGKLYIVTDPSLSSVKNEVNCKKCIKAING